MPSKRLRALPLALLVFALVAPASRAGQAPLVQDITLADVSLGVRLRAGSVVVEGGGEPGVARVTLRIDCLESDPSRCAEAARSAAVTTASSAERLTLGISGIALTTRVALTLHIVLPADRNVEIDVGAGDVRIVNLTGSIEVDVGAGDVEIDAVLAETAKVDLGTRAGRATLRLPDGTIVGSGLVGSALEWSREGGRARVEVDVGAGSIEATLHGGSSN